jgi:hypothetical protein
MKTSEARDKAQTRRHHRQRRLSRDCDRGARPDRDGRLRRARAQVCEIRGHEREHAR